MGVLGLSLALLAITCEILIVLPIIIKADDGSTLLDFISLADPSNAFSLWGTPMQNNLSNNDYCQWGGVTCDENKRVEALILEKFGLNGTILQDLFSRLDKLSILSLRQNKLRGTLPILSQAKNLNTLLLDDNLFNGPIHSLGNLATLTIIDLSNNYLSGNLPNGPNSNTLISFDVSNNNLSGPIPPSLSLFDKSSFRGNVLLCGPPLDARCPPPHSKSSGGLNKIVVLCIIMGIMVGGGLVGVGLLWCRKRRSQLKPLKGSPLKDEGSRKYKVSSNDKVVARKILDFIKNPNKNDTFTNEVPRESFDGEGNLEFIDVDNRIFELEDILKASAHILGRGILGTSYKATLEGGLEVVVKRLSLIDNCEKSPILEIMKAIGKAIHPNILPLKAHFYGKEEKLLIYDYMPTGSLFNALHSIEGRRNTRLDWRSRIRIAKGVASALDYIHTTYASSLTPPQSPIMRRCLVLHGNLKSTNIILGPDQQPYVADFGVAAMLASTAAQSYLAGQGAPECRNGTNKLTHYADVYSYGVLLLELLTGKMPVQQQAQAAGKAGSGGVDLAAWVESVVREEWTAEVFDRELSCNKVEEDELVSLLKLAMACVSPHLEQRPSMALVLQTISQEIPSSQDHHHLHHHHHNHFHGADHPHLHDGHGLQYPAPHPHHGHDLYPHHHGHDLYPPHPHHHGHDPHHHHHLEGIIPPLLQHDMHDVQASSYHGAQYYPHDQGLLGLDDTMPHYLLQKDMHHVSSPYVGAQHSLQNCDAHEHLIAQHYHQKFGGTNEHLVTKEAIHVEQNRQGHGNEESPFNDSFENSHPHSHHLDLDMPYTDHCSFSFDSQGTRFDSTDSIHV